MTATPTQHHTLAEAINYLVQGRQATLAGFGASASASDILAEHKLHQLFASDQVDELMSAWEYSHAVNPLELPEWRALLDPE